MALMMRVNGSTVVKQGYSRGAVRCAAVPMGHLDHAAPIYTHTSTAPSTEMVTYVGDHGRFPEPFSTLPPPELFQMADLGDDNDKRIGDAQVDIGKFLDDVKNKAANQLKNQKQTAPSTELVTYVGDHSRFPKPFSTLPPPELFQLADLGDKNDIKILDSKDKIFKDVIDNEKKAADQVKNQDATLANFLAGLF